MDTIVDHSLVADFTGQISGSVLTPEDAGYEAARAVHSGLVDRRPALIVRCRGKNDVVAALALARRTGLEVSVRGGGQNVAGRAVTEGGLMIDLAEMKGIAVDPERATATAEGGVIWGELNGAAAEHGLAVTGGAVSTTGIAGLTLGGGPGWLVAKYGLAADNLLAVELVTAEGEVLGVDATSYPDLFWALRSGGGNFGVATSFTYRLHPLLTVVGGLIAHPIAAAPELLRFYRDAVVNASDDLTVFAGLVHAPDGSGAKLAALVVCHTGAAAEAERDLEPFKAWGSPLLVEVGAMPYPVMNTILDAAFPPGSLNYWLSSFTHSLPDELIDIAVERFATAPSAMTSILLEHFHGAVTASGRPRPRCRTATKAGTSSSRPSRPNRRTRRRISPGVARRSRRCDPTSGAGAGSTTSATTRQRTPSGAAYGPNYERLREVKRRYDPENVFHLNHNIAP